MRVLRNIGFRDKILKLIAIYQTGNSKLKIYNTFSTAQIIEYGVLQRTTFGPLLFNTYINDLFSNNVKSGIISFAVDTALFAKDNEWEGLEVKVQNDLATLFFWFNSRKL